MKCLLVGVLVVVLGAAALGAAVFGIWGRDDPFADIEEDAALAREFDRFPIVWLGESYDAGEPWGEQRLRGALYQHSPVWPHFRFSYGDCEPRPVGGWREQCRIPIQFEVFPPCMTKPQGEGTPTMTIRGGGAWFAGGSLWVETTDFVVQIRGVAFQDDPAASDADEYARVQRERQVWLAEALVGANALASHITAESEWEPLGEGACEE